MLGAEGVKTLVIRRLMEVLPTSLQIRREILGCDPAELPDPVRVRTVPGSGPRRRRMARDLGGGG